MGKSSNLIRSTISNSISIQLNERLEADAVPWGVEKMDARLGALFGVAGGVFHPTNFPKSSSLIRSTISNPISIQLNERLEADAIPWAVEKMDASLGAPFGAVGAVYRQRKILTAEIKYSLFNHFD